MGLLDILLGIDKEKERELHEKAVDEELRSMDQQEYERLDESEYTNARRTAEEQARFKRKGGFRGI